MSNKSLTMTSRRAGYVVHLCRVKDERHIGQYIFETHAEAVDFAEHKNTSQGKDPVVSAAVSADYYATWK